MWSVSAETQGSKEAALRHQSLPNPQETPSLEQGCLVQGRQFPTIDTFVIFPNLCKHLVYLSQIYRVLFIQFRRIHPKELHSGVNLSFTCTGKTSKANAQRTPKLDNQTRDHQQSTSDFVLQALLTSPE